MSNQRKFNRRHSIYYLRIYDRDTNELVGHMVDISEAGMMLVCENAIKPGTKYKLSMQLPDTINNSSQVEFDAKCRWCRNDTNPDFYDVGFEVLNPSMAFLDTLKHLIEAYMFRDIS